MNADVILKKKEDAVSSVIGVMLMLVVTIVIAAVVAAFAGGIATDTEPTPSVVLTADVYTNKVLIQSLTGDRLEIDKLDVMVYKENGDLLSVGTITKPEGETYFTPGMKLSTTLTTYPSSGDRVQVVVSYNDKHTVLDKEVQVKSATA